MNDKLYNNQCGCTEKKNKAQTSGCADCKKNPCVCHKSHRENPEENTKNNANPAGAKPPKISWI